MPVKNAARVALKIAHSGTQFDAELREVEAELGHSVTRGLAQWFTRNRINREAVERMLAATDTNLIDKDIAVKKVLKKVTTKCA